MSALPAELAQHDRAPHVGRGDELAMLRASWQRAIGGDRRLVLIGGEPGIGKTRLAAELAGLLQQDDTLVLHGRCDPEAIFPYQPFAEALQPLASDAELFTRGVDRAALFAACAAILRSATNEQPVLLVIDDVHWATAASLALLRHLFRTMLGARLLLVVTYRDTEVTRQGPLADLLADLRNETGVERLTLGGLDRQAISALVDAIVDTSDLPDREGFVTDLERDTGGNPFFLGELLRDLRETRQRTTAVPASVHDVLTVRIGRLPEATRQHLAAAAAIGPRFDLGLLGKLDLDGDALDAIEPAVHGRLVLEDPSPAGHFRFAHALVRQTLLDDMGPTREARFHEQIGALLEAAGAPPAEIAAHFLATARPQIVERGARHALDAAAAVAWRSAPEAADQLAAAAVKALDAASSRDDELRVRLLCQQAEALLVLQRSVDFLAVMTRAVDTAKGTGSPELFALAVSTRGCYTPTGHTDESFITDIEDALATLDQREVALRARLHGGLALTLLLMGRDRYATIEHARAGAALADEVDELFVRWITRFAGGLAATHDPDPSITETFGRELIAIGAEYDDENATCHGLRIVAIAALIRGDIDGFTTTMTDVEARWRAIGNRWGHAAGIEARYFVAAARGDWTAAEGALDELLGLSATDPNFSAAYLGEVLMLRELQGRFAEVAQMLAMTAASYPHFISLSVAHGIYLLDVGERGRAEEILRAALAHPMFGVANFTEVSLLAWTTQLAAQLGATDVLPDLLRSLRRWKGQVLVVNLGIGLLGAVDAYLGLGCAALGERDEAERLFASALAWEEANGCRPLAERTARWRDAMRSGA